jgi:hypothetical protein
MTSYVQFNFSTLPTGASVSKATLRLYVDAVNKPGSFDVYELDTAWAENTLTYNTAPPLGLSATGNHPTAISASSLRQYVLVDITPLVQGWLSGAVTNNGVALALTSAGGNFSFDSKESSFTSNGPDLEIALTSSGGAQGPPGPAGPQGAAGPVGPPGPISGVTAGTDLTGGGTAGNVILSLDTTKVPQLNSVNTFTGNQTVNGNLSATGIVTGTGFSIGSNPFAFGAFSSNNVYLGFAGNASSSNTAGSYNTATGPEALYSNVSGVENTAGGFAALSNNTTGSANTASGAHTLQSNDSGNLNTAIGDGALNVNTSGSSNTAVGDTALRYNASGSSNTAVGFAAGTGSRGDRTNATAIGANAEVDEDNAVVLGSMSGVNGASADTFVGIGTTTPQAKLHIGFCNSCLRVEGPANPGNGTISWVASYGGYGDFAIDGPGCLGCRFVVKENGSVGIGTGMFVVSNIFTIAQNQGHAIADGWDTYSSRRWKTNIHPLTDALAKIEQLRGVSYDLKQSGKHEIGVIAEEVGVVVPEVVSYEDNGKDARGVDYSRLTALLIQAMKEQQQQMREQRAQIQTELRHIKAQQRQIVRLGNRLRSLEAGSNTAGITGIPPSTSEAIGHSGESGMARKAVP